MNTQVKTPPSPPQSKRRMAYDDWMESLGLPIYSGHHVEDLR